MRAGDLFEREYRIVRELGKGGTATVYLAEHVEGGQRVAIKLLNVPEERFQREGKVLARLTGPHTVRLLSFGWTREGSQYLLSEWVDGEPLSLVLQRDSPLEWSHAVMLIRQILVALSEAHQLGIVHRDIKPGNVMVMDGQFIKVLDFGAAKPLDARQITDAHQVLGTPRYLPPETLKGAPVTPSVDVFATGMLAYAMLSGRHANEGSDVHAIVARHISDEPYQLPENVPPEPRVREWLHKLMSKDPDVRPRDAAAALRSMPLVADAMVETDESNRGLRSDEEQTTNELKVMKRGAKLPEHTMPAQLMVPMNKRELPPRAPRRDAGEETRPSIIIEQPPLPAYDPSPAPEPAPAPAPRHQDSPKLHKKLTTTEIAKAKFWGDVPKKPEPEEPKRSGGEWTEGMPTIQVGDREVSLVLIAAIILVVIVSVVVMARFDELLGG